MPAAGVQIRQVQFRQSQPRCGEIAEPRHAANCREHFASAALQQSPRQTPPRESDPEYYRQRVITTLIAAQTVYCA